MKENSEAHDSMYPQKPKLVVESLRSVLSFRLLFLLGIFSSFYFFLGIQLRFIIVMFFALLLHELSHWLVLGLKNVKSNYFLLFPLFQKKVEVEKSGISFSLLFLSGGIPVIVLGLTSTFLPKFYPLLVFEVMFISCLLNIIFLLPVMPLLGGKLLFYVFPKAADKVQIVFTFILSIAIIAFGYYTQMYFICVTGFLMGIIVKRYYQHLLIRAQLLLEGINFYTSYLNLTNREFSRIKNQIIHHSRSLQILEEEIENEAVQSQITSMVSNVLIEAKPVLLSKANKIVLFTLWLSIFGSALLFIIYHLPNI